MESIEKTLQRMKDVIQTDDFLEGKGLSNEINIHIIPYKPSEEIKVREIIKQIKDDSNLKCNLIEVDLYDLFIQICEEKRILKAIPNMEAKKGKDYLIKQLSNACNMDEFIKRIQYEDHQRNDVLLITGVGKVYPFLRVHNLLNALQPHFTDVPIIVMYPGNYDGHNLKLFNKLESNGYYRAFNTI